ncbi:TolC-like outermembrane protein [Leptospira ryugenii]|uniref:TolC-like outermembrane protein n=1 Tax=Leptospira ryugenii TaxID=1917863 RepID=A0A2P2E480_9LEPT|nr:TolC family protein [Leptospira ryugenii]GBF51698.1 TolC-like outermembrane protein [Leptospira ryugenii]
MYSFLRLVFLVSVIGGIFSLQSESIDFYELPKVVGEKSYLLKLKEIEIQKKKIDIETRNLRYLPTANIDYGSFFEKLPTEGFDRKGYLSSLNLEWNFAEQGNVFLTNLILELEYERLLLEYRALYQKELFDQAFQYAETLKLLAFYDYDSSNEVDAEKQLQTIQKLYKQGIESYLVTQNSKVDYFFYKYNSTKSKLDQQKSQSTLRRKFLLKNVTLKEIPEREFLPLNIDETMAQYERNLAELNFDIVLSLNQVKILEIEKQVRFNDLWVPNFFVNVYNNTSRQTIYGIGGSFQNPEYLYNYSRNDFSLYASNPDYITNSGANFGFKFPLFNRWLSKNEYDKAKIDIKLAKSESEFLKENTALFLYELIQQHNNLVELYTIAKESKKIAEENYQIMERAYKTGSASIVELQTVDRRQREVLRSAIQNRYDLIQLRLQIGLLLGDTMKFLK